MPPSRLLTHPFSKCPLNGPQDLAIGTAHFGNRGDGQKTLLYLTFILIEITVLKLSIIAVKFMGKIFQIASNLNRLIS